MDVDNISPVPIGSDSWLGASEYRPGSFLHNRATKFFETTKWDILLDIASKYRGGDTGRYVTGYSIGHFNMVRRIVFDDGKSYVARLRLPDEGFGEGREKLDVAKAMEIEVASMKFFRFVKSAALPQQLTEFRPL